MGIFASCCRRRKPSSGSEREPLLPKQRVQQAVEATAPSQDQLNKLAEVLASLKAGKLPSEGQIEHALRYLLESEVLEESGGRAWRQYGSLSRAGTKAVRDVKEVIEAMLVFGREKNGEHLRVSSVFTRSRLVRRRYLAMHLLPIRSSLSRGYCGAR